MHVATIRDGETLRPTTNSCLPSLSSNVQTQQVVSLLYHGVSMYGMVAIVQIFAMTLRGPLDNPVEDGGAERR